VESVDGVAVEGDRPTSYQPFGRLDIAAGALTSPLSLPYVLEELVPKTATAVEGDPSLAPAS
jgi:hypothetical protein